MRIFYLLSIYFYGLIILFASLFNKKAKAWVVGRRGGVKQLEKSIGAKGVDYWFHCASLGEFEQARPIIEALKIENPSTTILLTFFSPSGYLIRKNYPHVDFIAYLPLDTLRNAKRFIAAVKPKKALIIKYEFWYNMLAEAKKRGVEIYYISAAFREEQPFFAFYGRWFVKQLKNIDYFCVQNQKSKQLLQSVGIKKVTVTGDTRYDRVATIAEQSEALSWVDVFKGEAKLIVCGSSWMPEEKIAAELVTAFPDVKFIIAPHNIEESHVSGIEKLIPGKTLRYSQWDGQLEITQQVVIVDTIGLLNKLYRYADIAIIGGGFSNALHNILEAAVYGVPVCYGDNTAKYPEGEALVAATGGIFIQSSKSFVATVNELLTEDNIRLKIGAAASDFVAYQCGATSKILSIINTK